ncbi:hypothetical protein K469DRAFT_43461 [Zopfia rhizophila CBS 207.26]|uniref:Zn(2)-C6 fungal-type domain-containing protein n=1 Tax=Zopfia rhizophila CBS 207.26 TaxID=1314779 RepID=A0A6A6EC70_9PEZI|nr:hypothetical protein K469DRAFT_43461 [Zopfia rhizophila CBS 207.26]
MMLSDVALLFSNNTVPGCSDFELSSFPGFDFTSNTAGVGNQNFGSYDSCEEPAAKALYELGTPGSRASRTSKTLSGDTPDHTSSLNMLDRPLQASLPDKALCTTQPGIGTIDQAIDLTPSTIEHSFVPLEHLVTDQDMWHSLPCPPLPANNSEIEDSSINSVLTQSRIDYSNSLNTFLNDSTWNVDPLVIPAFPPTSSAPDISSHSQRFPAIAPRPDNIKHGAGSRKRKAEGSSGPKSKRPPRPKNKEDRANALAVRRMGACFRCRKMGEKCDDGNPCGRCKETQNSARAFTRVCYRDNIENVVPFREGNSRAKQENSELPHLQWDANVRYSRTLQLRYPFKRASTDTLPELQLTCRKFVPKLNQDVLIDVWEGTDGRKLIIEFPSWACDVSDSTLKVVERYIDECEGSFEQDLSIEESDDITALTMAEAIRYASARPESCVNEAIKIRRIAYFCRDSMSITGSETLGMARVDDENFPIYNQVPVPSVLDFQIDTLAIQLMHSLRQRVTSTLHSKLFKKRRINDSKENWYEVYLVCFVLLTTLEKVYALQQQYSNSNKDMPRDTYLDIDYHSRRMMKQWEYAANNILHHFHCVLYGEKAFSFAWNGPLEDIPAVARANVDGAGLSYLSKLIELLKENDQYLREARNQQGKSFAWRSRLYLIDDEI